MDFYNMLKTLDENQIRELISFKIDEASYKSKINGERYIGVDCGANPNITLNGPQEEKSKAMWYGFIPADVKIVYSFIPNAQGFTVNDGRYYYLDDDSYIYDFALYIKDKEVHNYLEFLDYVWLFIETYFYNLRIPTNTRNEMFCPLTKDGTWYHEPTTKHSIKNFKGQNNAECSEYSALAQNILTVFGYQTLYFGGAVSSTYGNGGHAFNISVIEGTAFLLDFTIPVTTFDLKGNEISRSPFLGIIRNFSSDLLVKNTDESIPFEFPDYEFYLLNDKTIYHELDTKRQYIIGKINYFDLKNNQTMKKI